MIVTLVLLGQVLELRARQRTGAALRALLDLAPKEALRLQDDGSEVERAARSRSAPGIGCACARARRCPWTASCSKAAAPWTSRW